MVETKPEETVVGTALAHTESIEEVTRVPVLQAEDFNLRLLDDSQSIIELSEDIFHEESVDYYKERAQTNNYLDLLRNELIKMCIPANPEMDI